MSHPGHQQVRTDIPDPLSPGQGLQRIGRLALPASMLSLSSLLVFGFVFLFLQHDERLRKFYSIPWVADGYIWAVAVSAAVLAWIIVVVGSRRPGRNQPRWWALLLAVATSLIAAVAMLRPAALPVASIHAAISAGVAAVVALLPRVLKIHPDNVWSDRAAPLSLVSALALILPTAFFAEQTATPRQEQRISEYIDTFDAAAEGFERALGFDWTLLEVRPGEAERVVASLADMTLPQIHLAPEIWRLAHELDRSEALAAAIERLIGAVANGLRPESSPRLSLVTAPPVFFDTESKQWMVNDKVRSISRIVGSYYAAAGQLFRSLAPGTTGSDEPMAARLRASYETAEAQVALFLGQTRETWADNWAVSRFPGYRDYLSEGEVSLRSLLESALFERDGVTYTASRFGALLDIDVEHARRWQEQGIPGCEGSGYQDQDSDSELYRIDCYSYAPAPDDSGAVLRVELRIVYKASIASGGLRANARPVELYYSLPIPPELPSDRRQGFKDEAIQSLADAVEDSGIGVVQNTRERMVTRGFIVKVRGERLRVYRPVERNYVGNQKRVMIRVERL